MTRDYLELHATIPAALPSRRTVLAASAAAFALAALDPSAALATDPEPTSQFLAAYAKLTGETEPPAGPIKLDLPDIAENGNMVPFTIAVDNPMTPERHVRTLTLFSTGNPQPVIATFHFNPASGRAMVSGRLRLARTQDVIAVAELNTGERIKVTTRVEVTVGGCGAG